mmetsp:Transcript_28923/g.67329  ORF Transcript_28923/g.67329 Transcript_28923/m.67329 type:complete len:263 (+) Transcript_28923:206-994(+)
MQRGAAATATSRRRLRRRSKMIDASGLHMVHRDRCGEVDCPRQGRVHGSNGNGRCPAHIDDLVLVRGGDLHVIGRHHLLPAPAHVADEDGDTDLVEGNIVEVAEDFILFGVEVVYGLQLHTTLRVLCPNIAVDEAVERDPVLGRPDLRKLVVGGEPEVDQVLGEEGEHHQTREQHVPSTAVKTVVDGDVVGALQSNSNVQEQGKEEVELNEAEWDGDVLPQLIHPLPVKEVTLAVDLCRSSVPKVKEVATGVDDGEEEKKAG